MPKRVLVLDSPRINKLSLDDSPLFRVLATADELLDQLRDAHPATVVLLDPCDPEGGLDASTRAILAKAGVIPVIGLVDLAAAGVIPIARELFDLGISDIADLAQERTPEALLPRLKAAVGRPLKRRIEAVLPRYLSQNGITLTRAAVDAVVRGEGATALAAPFGSLERTVSGWCAREGLPPPRRLQAWLRLLLSLALLESSRRSILGAALAAGYSTEHSLRRTFKALINRGETTALRDYSFAAGAKAFVEELGAQRDLQRKPIA
jgi:hypothetical protein